MFRAISHLLNPPELERLPDDEAERLIWQARFRRGDAIWVVPLLAGLLAAGAWIGLAVVLTLAFSAIAGGQMISSGLTQWWALNVLVAIAFLFAAAALTRWVMIVRSIRLILNRAECPYCDFSLVGLVISDNSVRCPECGQIVHLHEHRIKPEDIEILRPFAAAGPMGAYRESRNEKQRAKSEKKGAGRRSAGAT